MSTLLFSRCEQFLKAFLPYGRQTISEADIEAVESVLRSHLTQGPTIPAFEKPLLTRLTPTLGLLLTALLVLCILPALPLA